MYPSTCPEDVVVGVWVWGWRNWGGRGGLGDVVIDRLESAVDMSSLWTEE